MTSRSIRLSTRLLLPLAIAGAALPGVALAADASIDQVYATARTGDVSGALGMMDQVLKDHPNSARAHYVEAELLAKAHRAADARAELAKAEQLQPGLPSISARSKAELRAALGEGGTVAPAAAPVAERGGFPFGPVIVIGLLILLVLAFLRRRQAAAYNPPMGVMPGYGPQGGPQGYGPGYGAPGYGGGPGFGGGGIMGSLASGAAMGAGFAAGEGLVEHMFGGERRGEREAPGGGWDQNADPNADMGGQDFGISGGGWDDGGSGGDGGW